MEEEEESGGSLLLLLLLKVASKVSNLNYSTTE